MHDLLPVQRLAGALPYFGVARVLAFDTDADLVQVRLTGTDREGDDVWAASAVPGGYAYAAGDRVLCAGETLAEIYIIGVLTPKQPEISLASGAYATVSGNALQVFSNEKQLMFEYDAQTNRARLTASPGDLEVASSGDIKFTAEQNIQLRGQQVEISGRFGMRLGLRKNIGALSDAIVFSPSRMRLQSDEVAVTARRGTLQTEETRISGKRFRGIFESADLAVGTLHTVAETVVEKVKNSYRSVAQLSQLTAGRLKTLVKSTIHIKSKRSYLHAEEDFKIDGDKIHLG